MHHEKRLEIRWRDCDAYGHVNNAVYATYLEEGRDAWIEAALGSAGDAWDYVLARVAIDFRRELTLADDGVLVRTELVRVGTSSLTLCERITTLDGTLAAESEAVLVARDRATGRSRPLVAGERTAFEAALASV
jgi:acyl-CoA thioester hydrolase